MRYQYDDYYNILKQTLDNLAIKNKYKLKLYDEVLYYRLTLDTTETYYPKKAMTLTLESDCLEQLINDYNRKELTKDDVVMLISYITYNNIYTKCKEYLENAINEIGNNSSYVKALIKLRDKTEKEINKIYLNNKDNLLYKYQLIIENDLLDYQYFN